MKKILLSVLACAIIFAGLSQNRVTAPAALRNTPAEWLKPAAESMNFNNYNGAVPSTVHDNTLLFEEHVGTTYYDLQTNSSMQNRIYKYDDGTIGVTYILGYNHASAFDDRGTGYNYFDGNDWVSFSSTRIEPDRTGWPSYAPLGEGGEVVVAHYASAATEGLAFSWREEKGTGDWQYFNVIGPGNSPGLAWPRLVTSGFNHSVMHLITLTLPVANGGVIYEGMDGALLYSRSNDGGTTWDPAHQIIDLIGSDYYNHWSGDSYVIDARDDVVAFVTGDSWTDLVMLKSMDGGDSWTKTVVWLNPYPFFDPSNPTVTDTFYCPDGSHDIAIDQTGKVHVVFGINRALCSDGSTLSWFPLVDGLGYWNEDRPLFSNDLHALDPYGHPNSELVEDYSLIGWAQDVNGNGVWDILGEIGLYYVGVSSMPTMVVDEMNQVFVVYSSVTETFDNGVQDYRRIWGRASPNGGEFWSEFVDFTNTLPHLFDECVFPSLSPNSDESVHLVYQFDTEPGMHVKGDEDDPTENSLYYMSVTKPEFLMGIRENTLPITGRDVSEVLPNPAREEVRVKVNLRKKVTLRCEVIDITGQLVYRSETRKSLPGMHTLTVDCSEWAGGMYLFRIIAGETMITKKMMVEK